MDRTEVHVYLDAEESDLLEQLRCVEEMKVSKNAAIRGLIRHRAKQRGIQPRPKAREMAKKRGFVDDA